MKLNIGKNEERILIAFQKEVFCSGCLIKEWQKLYFCEQDKELFCKKCHKRGKACRARKDEHIDWKLDQVKIRPDDKNLIMNKEKLKNGRTKQTK